MSQGAVSMDLLSNVAASGAAAPRAVDPNGNGHNGSEFAAHLRQADRAADRDSAPTRGSRDGGTPRRTERSSDDSPSDATDDAAAATSSPASATTPATADASAGSSDLSDPAAGTTTGGSAGSSPDVTPGAVLPAAPATGATVAASAVVAEAAAAAAAPAAPAEPGTAGIGGAGVSSLAGVLAPSRAQGQVGSVLAAAVATSPGAMTGGTGAGSVAAPQHKPAPAATRPVVPGDGVAGPAPAHSQPTDQPGNADPAVLGAATGSANPAGVVPSGPATPAAQVRFEPGNAVQATGSATASAAPAPSTTAPQTSVAGQLSASLRTLAGKGDGVHVMTVRLHPDELGPVRVIARLTGSDVHLRVTTSTVAAAAAVSEATPRLHDALTGSGLNATGLSVDHDADLLGQSSGQPAGQHTAGPSVDGGNAGRSGANGSGPGTDRSGHNGSVTVDAPPEPTAVRHPTARSLDLHV